MWIFLKDAFLSITKVPEQSDLLLVRARFRGDIERLFPDAHVLEKTGTDYRYRTQVSVGQLAKSLEKKFHEIDYSNFSGSVPDHDKIRDQTYRRVLQGLRDSQKFLEVLEDG